MQYLSISDDTKLIDLSNRVGARNVEQFLALNDLKRGVRIGQQFSDMCDEIIASSDLVVPSRKAAILNTMTEDSDVFEAACCADENAWKVLSALNTFPTMMKVPESIHLPDSLDLIGNGIAIGKTIYDNIMHQLQPEDEGGNGGITDLSVFNEVSNIRNVQLTDNRGATQAPFSQYFKIPWGEVTLYSSLAGESIDFPVYPEEMQDSRSANFGTMPDMIYQYEPWYVYESSGPRSMPFTFKMHRHLWTGDHADGKANELIRFCQANCYPQYNGSSVNAGTVSLYIHGQCLINGVLKRVNVNWSGPLADDGWYLYFEMQLDIDEVSKQTLDFDTVRNLPLIG